MRKINQAFYITIFSTLAVFAGTVYLYFELFKRFPSSGYVYGSLFLVLFLLIFLLTYVTVRIESIIMRKNVYLITKNQEPPKNIKRAFNGDNFLKNMISKGFKIYSEQTSYTLLYLCEKDHIKKIFKHHVLQVIVYVDEHENEFYLEKVDEELAKLKEQLYKEKKRPTTTLISQYKVVSTITTKTKEQLMENILLKNRYGIYSVINIALDKTSNKAVFLHSLTFSPSLYYKHQVEQILDFV